MMGSEHHRRKKARDLLNRSGYRSGGHLQTAKDDHAEDKAMIEKAFREHDEQLHDGKHTRLRLADGGAAMGDMAMERPDRASRGSRSAGGKGKGHGKTNINIVMAPGGGQQQPPEKVPVPVPTQPRAAPPPPPQAPPPPRPAGAAMPPGAMPPGLAGAGAPPMGAPPPGGMPPGMPMRKDGGRAPMAHLEAGKGSGVGRLELSKEMGRDEHRLRRGGKAEEAWCAGGAAR